jgi:hypothetical protein
MVLSNRTTDERKMLTLSGGAFLSTGVRLAPGVTTFALEVVEPKAPPTKVPIDPRSYMVALWRFQVHLWARPR